MSRDIKFRAWDKDKGIMNYNIQGYYDNLGWDYYPKGVGAVFGDFLDNEYQEVMQYTGLKDKNGKEIYEGDILRLVGIEYDKPLHYQVVYEAPTFIITRGRYKGDVLGSLSEYFEVIGNIYENPELFKGENNDITN